MRDLREGVKLKKVQERQYNPLPIEYQLTPYEMLMDDIRSKRYKLRKVMVSDFLFCDMKFDGINTSNWKGNVTAVSGSSNKNFIGDHSYITGQKGNGK